MTLIAMTLTAKNFTFQNLRMWRRRVWHRRIWAACLALLLALPLLTSCVAVNLGGGRRTTGTEKFPGTVPIYYHGIRFQFECEEGKPPTMLLPGPEIDLLGVLGEHRRAVERRYNSFYVGGHRCDFLQPGFGPARLYLPVKQGQPWRHRFEDLEIIWFGEPPAFAVEQATDMRVTWQLGAATVVLKKSGKVEYKHGKDLLSLHTPLTLRLDASGRRMTGLTP